MCDASPLCRTTLRTNSFSSSKKQRQMQHAAHPHSVSKRCLLTDWEWIWWHPVWTLGLCLSPWCRPHTYFPVWCCPRINCTLLSWDDIQATKRQQGQWGLEEKVSVAHKTKRHLRFNKINKCCWKDLLGLSHREREGHQLNSLGFAVTQVESSRKPCKKLQESFLENVYVFPGYFSWTFGEGTSPSFSLPQLFALRFAQVLTFKSFNTQKTHTRLFWNNLF